MLIDESTDTKSRASKAGIEKVLPRDAGAELIASAVDISERKNAELRLEVEHDLAQALAAGMQRDEVLGELLKAIQRFPDLDAGCVHWRQADGSYRLIAHQGISAEFAEKISHLDADSPFAILAQIKNAGAIFMGPFTSEAFGDYCAGPNHVLPTSRSARFSSPLGVYDFQKRSSVIMCSELGVAELGAVASVLARGESLTAHARSVEIRLEEKRQR